jgi:hypothetical protein
MHALILCLSHSYAPGLVLVWEKMGIYEDVLRFWMDRDGEGNTPEASSQVVLPPDRICTHLFCAF